LWRARLACQATLTCSIVPEGARGRGRRRAKHSKRRRQWRSCQVLLSAVQWFRPRARGAVLHHRSRCGAGPRIARLSPRGARLGRTRHRRAQHVSSVLRDWHCSTQDLKYGGEPTALEIGDGNTIRENVTIKAAGTAGGGRRNRLGSNCLLMPARISATTARWVATAFLANCATLAGTVIIRRPRYRRSVLPSASTLHCGKYAFIGGGT